MDNEFLVIFFLRWLSESIDPMRVKEAVLHCNYLFSLKTFIYLEMTSSNKAEKHCLIIPEAQDLER